MRILSPGTRIT